MKKYSFTTQEVLIATAELPACKIGDMKKFMSAFSKKIHEDFGDLSYLHITEGDNHTLCAYTSEWVCVEA